MKYHAVKRADPRDPTLPSRYYAAPSYNVLIPIRELKKEIARFTTVSGPDISAVLDATLELVPDLLKRGHIVSLGDLGTLYPTFASEGQETEEAVTAQSITQARIRFRASKWLKQAMTFLEFTRDDHGNDNGVDQTKKEAP